MPYGRIQGQGQGHEPIQGSSIENLQSREVDRQSPTGLIFILWNVSIQSGKILALVCYLLYRVTVIQFPIFGIYSKWR